MPIEAVPIPPPDPLGLPAHPLWFVVLLHVTFLLHLLFMNATLGGTLIACGLNVLALRRGRSADSPLTLSVKGSEVGRREAASELARVLHQAIPISTSLAITFGVAPLLFVQVLYGQFFYTAFVFMGPTWLAALVALLLAFYAVYLVAYHGSNRLLPKRGRWDDQPGRRLAVSCVAAVLLLAVAWVFTQNHVLSLHPGRWAVGQEWKIGRLFVNAPMSLPRYVHNVAGAVAVSGMWLVGLGWWRRRRGLDAPEQSLLAIRLGFWIFGVVVLVQAVMGPALLFSLDGPVRAEVFGFDTIPGGVWTVVLFTALPLQLVAAWFGVRQPSRGRWALLGGAAMLVTLVGMVLVREQVRVSYLRALDHPNAPGQASLMVYPQGSAIAVFLVAFLTVVALVGLMLVWLARKTPAPTSTQPMGDP